MILPRPTEQELTPFNKVVYVTRILMSDFGKDNKIPHMTLTDMLTQNYDKIYLYENR
jgi:hypothetical protein